MDLALQNSVLGIKTLSQHGRNSRQYDKGIRVRAGGGCARNDSRCGETLSANRLI